MYIDIFFTIVVLSFSLSTSTCMSIQKIIIHVCFPYFNILCFLCLCCFLKKIFLFAFLGFILCFYFFHFFFNYFHFFSGELKYVRVGDKQSKIQKTCKKSIFFFSRIKMSFVNTMNNVRRSLCKLGL